MWQSAPIGMWPSAPVDTNGFFGISCRQAGLQVAHKDGPLSVLQDTRRGGPREDVHIRQVLAWLKGYLRDEELRALSSLALFRWARIIVLQQKTFCHAVHACARRSLHSSGPPVHAHTFWKHYVVCIGAASATRLLQQCCNRRLQQQ